MSVRSAALLVSAALLACSTTAAAQGAGTEDLAGDYALEPLDTVFGDSGRWDGAWDGGWVDGETWRGMWHGTFTDLDGNSVETRYRGTFIGDSGFVSEDGRYLVHSADAGWREDVGRPDRASGYGRGMRQTHAGGPVLGYSFAEREAWLADCRAIYLGDAYFTADERERGGNGGLIGGVLGAVAGGIAGNRIASGERLAGTLIGAGVGGLAGLAIGALIGRGGDDREAERRELLLREQATVAEYCESYLRRYEAGGYGSAHMYAVQPQTVSLVRTVRMVPADGTGTRRQCTTCREIVQEERIEEPRQPARRSIAPRPAPQPRPTKRLPIE